MKRNEAGPRRRTASRSTCSRRPRGRRCTGTSSANDVAPVKPGHEREDVRPAEDLRRRTPSAPARRTARRAARASRRRRRAAPGRSGSASRARSCGSRARAGRRRAGGSAASASRACATGSTPSTEKTGSVAGGRDRLAPAATLTPPAPAAQVGEERGDRVVEALAAADALPARLDRARRAGRPGRSGTIAYCARAPGRLTISASASGSRRSRTGLAAHSASQASSSSSDSVAPAGLGYSATTEPVTLLRSRKARPIGIWNAAQTSSGIAKSSSHSVRTPGGRNSGRPSASTSTSRRRR